METLRGLFLKNNNYIIEVNLNDSQYLFIEGLDENGCTNTNKCFDIKILSHFVSNYLLGKMEMLSISMA